MAIQGFNHIVLNVADVQRSVSFYQQVLGFVIEAEKDENHVFMRLPNVPGDHHLALFATQGETPAKNSIGLDHFALTVQSEGELRQWQSFLEERSIKTQLVDHGSALSLYAHDPDGIQFELTFDRH